MVSAFVEGGHAPRDDGAHQLHLGAEVILERRGVALPRLRRDLLEGDAVETVLGLTQTHDGKFKMVLAEGRSLPGLIPATGNTNTRARFSPDVRTFLERWSMAGPTHHFALGLGHRARALVRIAECLDLVERARPAEDYHI